MQEIIDDDKQVLSLASYEDEYLSSEAENFSQRTACPYVEELDRKILVRLIEDPMEEDGEEDIDNLMKEPRGVTTMKKMMTSIMIL